MNCVFQNQILNIWPIFANNSCTKSTTYRIWCIFKVHLQNQSNSLQCLQPPPPLPLCDGGFQKVLYRRNIGQTGIFGEDWHFRWGDFFQVGLKNSMYKNIECKSQIKKMILIPNVFFWGLNGFFASCN